MASAEPFAKLSWMLTLRVDRRGHGGALPRQGGPGSFDAGCAAELFVEPDFAIASSVGKSAGFRLSWLQRMLAFTCSASWHGWPWSK